MDEPAGTGDAREDTTDWRELREFRGVDLGESFVLSWRIEDGRLRLDADLCLEPRHPFYEAPRPSQRACYHAATIEFPACTRLAAKHRHVAGKPLSQVAKELGLGRISGLKRTSDGVYRIHGAFGEVEIRSDRPLLRLKSSAAP